MEQTQQIQTTDTNIEKSKQIAENYLNPVVWKQMENMASHLIQSGAMPNSMNASKALIALQAGLECGLSPIEAVNSFYFVNGKIAMYGEVAIAQVMKAGHDVSWGECNDKTATCTITRGDNGKSMTSTFTFDMAIKRNLTGKGGPWVTAPENMLKFKAFWSVARFLVTDALHGVRVGEVEEDDVPAATTITIPTPITKKKEKPLKASKSPKTEESIAEGEIIENSSPEATEKATDESTEELNILANEFDAVVVEEQEVTPIDPREKEDELLKKAEKNWMTITAKEREEAILILQERKRTNAITARGAMLLNMLTTK